MKARAREAAAGTRGRHVTEGRGVHLGNRGCGTHPGILHPPNSGRTRICSRAPLAEARAMQIRTLAPLRTQGFAKLLLCVCTGTATEIDGFTVDVATAAAILGRYLALSAAGRARMELLPVDLALALTRHWVTR